MRADHDTSVEFGLLGPLVANVAGSTVPLRSAKTRIVLASLLLRANQVVSVEELVDRLWDSSPPRGARNAAQSYVMRLRNTLGSAGTLIRTHPSGYSIETTSEMIDVDRFRGHLATAEAVRSALALVDEARELRAAVALWRGDALSDVPSELLRLQEAPHLAEMRLQALERLVDVELALGRHAEIVGELNALTEENPLREPFWEHLMLALYRSGRQAQALTAYGKVCALLRDQLGVDPGDALQDLNQRILGKDRTLTGPQRPPTPPHDPWTVSFQLPGDVPDFVGRSDVLAQLRDLTTGPRTNDLAVPVVVLSGPPGAGKTAVAVRAAHTLRPDFPDGQLYVNMRGYSSSPPLTAGDALARFLRALGVAPDAMPDDVDEQSTLLRSLLRGRKVLMVLDNAANPDQIRPLLPADPSCAVLVTSRNNLYGLTALNGARRLPIGMVSMQEAKALVANIAGDDRVSAEPEAASALAMACGFLPLALRIASTNLASSTDLTIAEYVHKLQSANRLDEFSIEGDDQAAIRLAFDLSYSTLKPTLSHFFRMLSLIPGPEFDDRSAAAVTGVDVAGSRRMLDQLAATNLIENHTRNRFQFHDLIKEFAAERADDQDDEHERRPALRRLLAYYLKWADSACRLRYPDAYIAAVPDLGVRTPSPEWDQPSAALAWLDTEAENLVAMTRAASASSLPVWALADTLLAYLQRQRHDSIWEPVFTAALDAAEHFGDEQAQASVHRGLGRLQMQHARYADAEMHMKRAVQLYRTSGDVIGEARSRTGLGALALEMNEYDEAIEHYEQSLRLVDAGDDASRCTTLFDLGVTLVHMGRTAEGEANLIQAGKLARDADFPHILTRCTAVLAFSNVWRGELSSALHGFEQALAAWQNQNYRPGVIETVRNIAEIGWEAGRYDVALDLGSWTLAEAQKIRSPWLTAGSHVVVGNSLLALGDVGPATRHLEDAKAIAGDKLSYWIPAITHGLAACRRLAGNPAEAVALASTVAEETRPRERARAHIELAASLLVLGRHTTAVEHVRQAADISAGHGYRLDHARVLRTRGLAYSAEGDSAAAAAADAQAAITFDDARKAAEPALDELTSRLSTLIAAKR